MGHGDERKRTAEEVSKAEGRRQHRGGVVTPGAVWEHPADGPDGVRHAGGVPVVQAGVWHVGTCRPEVKGAAQVDTPQEPESRSGAQGRSRVSE
jgi:hypothetical protein